MAGTHSLAMGKLGKKMLLTELGGHGICRRASIAAARNTTNNEDFKRFVSAGALDPEGQQST